MVSHKSAGGDVVMGGVGVEESSIVLMATTVNEDKWMTSVRD